jgi:hypothetical protein
MNSVSKYYLHENLYLKKLKACFALFDYTDEKPMSYLYTQLQFQWTAEAYSDYRTYQNASYVVGMCTRLVSACMVIGMNNTANKLSWASYFFLLLLHLWYYNRSHTLPKSTMLIHWFTSSTSFFQPCIPRICPLL